MYQNRALKTINIASRCCHASQSGTIPRAVRQLCPPPPPPRRNLLNKHSIWGILSICGIPVNMIGPLYRHWRDSVAEYMSREDQPPTAFIPVFLQGFFTSWDVTCFFNRSTLRWWKLPDLHWNQFRSRIRSTVPILRDYFQIPVRADPGPRSDQCPILKDCFNGGQCNPQLRRQWQFLWHRTISYIIMSWNALGRLKRQQKGARVPKLSA